jgi:hypothetical protein
VQQVSGPGGISCCSLFFPKTELTGCSEAKENCFFCQTVKIAGKPGNYCCLKGAMDRPNQAKGVKNKGIIVFFP